MQLKAAGDRRLADRVAVVTGAGRAHGIGKAICLRLAAEGARVVVLDLDAAAHPEHQAAMREQRALARDEVPTDLAGPAYFLASPDSDFMTCQTILVDGGRSMW